MTSSKPNSLDTRSEWPPSFRFGVRPAAALVLAFTVWVTVSATTFTWLFGHEYSLLAESLWSIPSGLVQIAIVAAVYRYDGVTLPEVGLSRQQLWPAVVGVAGVLLSVNGAVVGLAHVADNELSVGLYAIYQSAPFNLSWAGIVAAAVSSYVFVGPVEELAFRGYLQTKLISLLPISSIRVRTAASVVLTGTLFSALHIPVQLLIYQTPVPQLTGMLGLLALSGVIFGAIYALTQNLYLVIFLHGIGDFWPLVVDPGQGVWPNYLVLLLIYLVLVVTYRQLSTRTAIPVQPLTAPE